MKKTKLKILGAAAELVMASSLSLDAISKPEVLAETPEKAQVPRMDLNREQRRSIKYGKKKGW